MELMITLTLGSALVILPMVGLVLFGGKEEQ